MAYIYYIIIIVVMQTSFVCNTFLLQIIRINFELKFEFLYYNNVIILLVFSEI